jgi:hypothetical protein
MQVEYRVRPVTRYIVTRFFKEEQGSGSEFKGEFDSPHIAYQVGYALAKDEHERLGYPIGDERIQYPRTPVLDCIDVGSGWGQICKLIRELAAKRMGPDWEFVKHVPIKIHLGNAEIIEKVG